MSGRHGATARAGYRGCRVADRTSLFIVAPLGRAPREGEWQPVVGIADRSAIVCCRLGHREHVPAEHIRDDGSLSVRPCCTPWPSRLEGWVSL